MARSQAVPSTEDNLGNFPATPSRDYAAHNCPTMTLPPITSLVPPSPEIPWSQSQHSSPSFSHYSPRPSPIPLCYCVDSTKENVSPAARAGYTIQRAKKGLPSLATTFSPLQYPVQPHPATRVPPATYTHTPTRAHIPATEALPTVHLPSPTFLVASTTAAVDEVSLPSAPLPSTPLPPAPDSVPAPATRSKRVTAKSSTQGQEVTMAKRGCPKVTGTGAKSGQRNRRAGGASGTEIMKLSEKDLELASLKAAKPRLKSKRVSKTAVAKDSAEVAEPVTVMVVDDGEGVEENGKVARGNRSPLSYAQKVKIVTYIADEERWPRFKLNKHSVYVKIANEVLSDDETDGAVLVEVIRNYWINNAWAKYKAVKEREKHTGGGDSDDSTQSAVAISTGNKRKKTEAGFSAQVLEEFQNSEIFEIIDAVAYADVDVVREEDINSCSNVSDDEIEDVTPRKRPKRSPSDESIGGHHHLLSEAVDTIKQKARHTEAIARQNLELAQRCDQREEEECQE